MGNDTDLFFDRNLERYNFSKDQTIFGPIPRLPMYILESIGVTTVEVANHIMSTSDIALYHSSPPRLSQLTAVHDPQSKGSPSTVTPNKPPNSKRVKSIVVSRKTLVKIVTNRVAPLRKIKVKTTDHTPTVASSSPTHGIPVNIPDEH